MDAKEYNQCVDSYSDELIRYLVRGFTDEETAQDILQSIYEKLWIKRDLLDINQVRAYLYSMARNKAIDLYRKNHRIIPIDRSHDVHVESGAGRFEDHDLINYYFRDLNENQKSIILLRDYEGHSYEEIGEIMGLTISQVKINLFRARKKVQSTIKKKDPQTKAEIASLGSLKG